MRTWKTLGLSLLMLIGCMACASIRGYHADPNDTASPIVYGKGFGDRSHLVPDGVAEYHGLACDPWRVKLAYGHMLKGVAKPGEALFYYRCRGPNEYQQMLKEIKSRWNPRP
jgi:hypothetical protein